MTNPEIYYQHDMFTGDLVDRRTRTQKKRDREQNLPKQMELFRAEEIYQFGVTGKPRWQLEKSLLLFLECEDPRTEEEQQRDEQQAAERLTVSMFSAGDNEPEATHSYGMD